MPRMIRVAMWMPMPAAAALGFLFLVKARQSSVAPDELLFATRFGAVAICLGSAFALDDPARETVAAASAPLLFRRAMRVALLAALAGVLWAGISWFALTIPLASTGAEPILFPVGPLTLEFAAMLLFTWAAACVASLRMADGVGGVVAGPALLAFVAGAVMLGRWRPLFSSYPNAEWVPAHQRWVVVLCLALVVLVSCSQDPARRRLGSRLRSRAGTPSPP